MSIQTNCKLESRRLMLEKRCFAIQKQQLAIIPIPFYPYMTASNLYILSQSSFNTGPFKPDLAYHISPK